MFTYWASGEGAATVTAALTFGSSPSATCAVITPIATWATSLVNGSGSSSSTNIGQVILPANSYLCWQLTVLTATKGGLDLRFDGNNQETNITTPSIVVPEHALPLLGVAGLLPLAALWLVQRPKRRATVRIR